MKRCSGKKLEKLQNIYLWVFITPTCLQNTQIQVDIFLNLGTLKSSWEVYGWMSWSIQNYGRTEVHNCWFQIYMCFWCNLLQMAPTFKSTLHFMSMFFQFFPCWPSSQFYNWKITNVALIHIFRWPTSLVVSSRFTHVHVCVCPSIRGQLTKLFNIFGSGWYIFLKFFGDIPRMFVH